MSRAGEVYSIGGLCVCDTLHFQYHTRGVLGYSIHKLISLYLVVSRRVGLHLRLHYRKIVGYWESLLKTLGTCCLIQIYRDAHIVFNIVFNRGIQVTQTRN